MTPLIFVGFAAVVVAGVAVFDGLDRRQTARDRDAARMARSARVAGEREQAAAERGWS